MVSEAALSPLTVCLKADHEILPGFVVRLFFYIVCHRHQLVFVFIQ